MKGIILAGGLGTRLNPITHVISKQLLPVYDKPMIYYPLSTLLLAKITDILIISTPRDIPFYMELLGDGSKFGIKLNYKVQTKPEGLAQAFLLGEEFIGKESVCLILGDNIFYGSGFSDLLLKTKERVLLDNNAEIFAYKVNNPNEFGIVNFDENNIAINIEEKPINPKSNNAVVGLYFFPSDCVNKAKNVKKSNRGEYEISSLNNFYLKEQRLRVNILGRGYSWLDTGSHKNLIDASLFVKIIEERTKLKIGCLEEISLRNGYITKEQIKNNIADLKGEYYEYLNNLIYDK